MRGEQNDRNVGSETLQLAHQVHACFARHLEVGQNDLGRPPPDRNQCGVRVRSSLDAEPSQLEPLRDGVADLFFIIDNQDCGIHVWIATAL